MLAATSQQKRGKQAQHLKNPRKGLLRMWHWFASWPSHSVEGWWVTMKAKLDYKLAKLENKQEL
jgi:hypothetical protein